ncbi:MAG TPA: Gfo/Idh/MocA family oxidoreductase [Gemmatimonadales bacterium]|nr:Gfo/Idh/MocA family oxidoreductase [Gemmatimonadales bacterium]
MRLGFLGTGWIGRHRLEAIRRSGVAEIAAVADVAPGCVESARAVAPEAVAVDGLEPLLGLDLDGIVIATPSALHAEQAIRALRRGLPVFCQKPLGRNAEETREVVEAARRAGCLLGADFSYRYLTGFRRIQELADRGGLGRLYAADLVFHNAYGPDKRWFYDPALSGGGCVMDLGIHLVDLALVLFGWAPVTVVASHLFARGAPLESRHAVEDYAAATLAVGDGAVVRIACSWNLPAGRDAVIGLELIGTEGSAALTNVDGSFYDFAAEHRRGTAREPLAAPPDDWGGRAAVDWARRVARGERFDPAAERFVTVAAVLDAIYEAGVPAVAAL